MGFCEVGRQSICHERASSSRDYLAGAYFICLECYAGKVLMIRKPSETCKTSSHEFTKVAKDVALHSYTQLNIGS